MSRPDLHVATDRVIRLRAKCLERAVGSSVENVRWPGFERELYFGESLMRTRAEIMWIKRRGQAVADTLRYATVHIDSDELIVGRPNLDEPSEEERERLAKVREFIAAQPPAHGQSGHMSVDMDRVVRMGARAIQDEIGAKRDALDPAAPDSVLPSAFYEAAWEALEGLMEFAGHHAQEAERLATEASDPRRRAELMTIAQTCRRVPAYPARSFVEALQAVHFVNHACMWADGASLMCPGRMDRWLWPYYCEDVAAGVLTPAAAQELIDCLSILINETVPRGLAIGAMVGGRDENGNDVTNELSYMVLQTTRNVRLSYPGTGLCYSDSTPDDLLALACEINAEIGANPAIFNDVTIPDALQKAGCTRAEACEYQNSTCVEISPIGCSGVWVASPYFNLSQILLDVLRDVAAGELEAADFDALMQTYRTRLGQTIGQGVAEQNAFRHSCMAHRGFPLVSCFVNDCIERGMDIDWGGARHSWIECSFVGLANLVDSLAVMREFVYRQESVSLRELLELLESDFAGNEEFRQKCLNAVPSYGNDEPEVDKLAVEVTDFVAGECAKYEVAFGSGFKPGFFCWVMHERLGSQTGATPDGRKAHFPFADGAGPAQGREKKGPTAAVKSVTCWDHRPMLGGLVLNLKFSKSALASAESQRKLAELVKTYMRLGGFEVQFNVVDRKTLLEARECPEAYRDLVVRVAGYTDYFVGLTPAMQEEVIMRTEYADV